MLVYAYFLRLVLQTCIDSLSPRVPQLPIEHVALGMWTSLCLLTSTQVVMTRPFQEGHGLPERKEPKSACKLGDSMETWMVSVCLSERRKGQSQKVSTAELPFCHPSVRLTLGFFSFVVLARFPLCRFFSSVSPSPPLPPSFLSPTTKKGENRRPVKRRSGLSTGRPVCRGLKVDDIRSVSGGSGLSSGRPVCKWTTSALSINIQNAEHPVCKWTPKTSGL